jgi:hypothetical protein
MPVRVALAVVLAAVALAAPQGEQPDSDLFTRVGFTAAEAATARSGQRVVRTLPSEIDTQVSVAGAIRIRGDVERLASWLRDIEEFRRALGAEVVGAIDVPAKLENFSGGTTAEAEHLLASATAYQRGGDQALSAARNPKAPDALAAEFKDMLRRAVRLWRLAYAFAAYLEEYPAKRPAGVDDRFYWTRESTHKTPVVTLHHVVLERLPDKSLRLADKQFYASRDIDAALLVGQATPVPGGSFDLVIVLHARVPRLGSAAARVLRNRVNREVTESFGAYLDWLKASFALG